MKNPQRLVWTNIYLLIRVFIIPLILLTSCCTPYGIAMLRKTTGFKLDNSIKICGGTGVQNQDDCEPSGMNWEKTKSKISNITLVSNDDDAITAAICRKYIFQNIRGFNVAEFHTHDIYNDQAKRGLIEATMANFDLKQFYEEQAITEAKSQLKATFSRNNVAWSADVSLKFENELKRQFQINTNNQGAFKYIVINLNRTGLPDDTCIVKDWVDMDKCFKNYRIGNYDLITGIAGYALINYNINTKIYEETWVKTALDIALSGQTSINTDPIKADLSSSIVNTVNKKISTEFSGIANKSFFEPMWIMRASSKQISVDGCQKMLDLSTLNFGDNESFEIKDDGDYTIVLKEKTMGNKSEASLCIEGNNLPNDRCRHLESWSGDWNIHLLRGQKLKVWVKDIGSSAGGVANAAFINSDHSTCQFNHGSFKAILKVTKN